MKLAQPAAQQVRQRTPIAVGRPFCVGPITRSANWLAECLVLTASSGSDQDEGLPKAPAPRTPLPAHLNGAPQAGAVGPASPTGRFTEAPAAAHIPPTTQREFPKSRPQAGAMLISPIFASYPERTALAALCFGAISKRPTALGEVRHCDPACHDHAGYRGGKRRFTDVPLMTAVLVTACSESASSTSSICSMVWTTRRARNGSSPVILSHSTNSGRS
jgi:hypothetical protein